MDLPGFTPIYPPLRNILKPQLEAGKLKFHRALRKSDEGRWKVDFGFWSFPLPLALKDRISLDLAELLWFPFSRRSHQPPLFAQQRAVVPFGP